MSETVSIIIQIVNGVGFPIAACCAMGAFIVWDKKRHTKSKAESDKVIGEALASLQKTVENNTDMLKELISKMGG